MNINNPHLNCHTIDKIARDGKIINLLEDYFENESNNKFFANILVNTLL